MSRAYLSTPAGAASAWPSSTADLYDQAVQAMYSPAAIEGVLTQLFGFANWTRDPAGDAWIVTNPSAPGTALVVTRGGGTIEICLTS